ARLNTSRAQANSLLAHHFFVTSSLLALQIDHCKCPTADHGAQSLQLSTRASTHPARAPLKSPSLSLRHRRTERISRDFVPWRFSDAGRRSVGPAHKQTHAL